MQHRIVVLGAGYTGATAAGRLAGRLHREDVALTLVNAEPDFVERVRMHQLASGQDLAPRPLGEMFAGTGVTLKQGKVTALDVDRRTVTVAAVGTDGTGEPRDEELEYDTLVYAIGDAALVMGPADKPLRMSCASGIPTAWQAADSIAARLTGGRLPDVPLRYFNQCVSLGRRDGLIQYVTADDRAVRAALTGRLAALYKELVCKGAAWGVAHPIVLPARRRRVLREAVVPEGSPVGAAA
jgi:NADH dehydrogenase FAD-containing subunit